MRKLILVILLLVAVLLLSIWAKGANFSLMTMIAPLQPLASQSAHISSKKTPPATPTIMTEILITVTPNGFVPSAITITEGTKLTWVNKSGRDANVSSHTYPALNLGNFGENNSVSYIFTGLGRFSYYNNLNPSTAGVVIVQ